MWGAAAAGMRKYKYPAADDGRGWKNVLLYQFHDILPGSSIRRVYEEAEAAYARSSRPATEYARRQAVTCLTDKGNG